MSLNPQGRGGVSEEINLFLASHRRPSNGYSSNDWRNHTSQSDVRSPRSISTEFLARPQTADSETSSVQNYTLTTATASNRSPSLFDGSARRGRGSDSVSHFSAHPSQAPVSFAQQFHQDYLQPPSTAPGSGPHLWCELAVPQNCTATFALDDVEGWIEHHMDHMGDRFPAACICWFCDHVVFPSQAYPFEPLSNFRWRMEHIHRHIWDDYQTLTDMRPDFHMLDHLLRIGVLTRQQRRHMGRFNELPDRLSLPGLSPDGGAMVSSAEPSRRTEPVFHDLEKERRALKRQKRHNVNQGSREK